MPSVPAGHYYLRIEPEADARHPADQLHRLRDIATSRCFRFYGWGFLALFLPAAFISLQGHQFRAHALGRKRSSDFAKRRSD